MTLIVLTVALGTLTGMVLLPFRELKLPFIRLKYAVILLSMGQYGILRN